jgi:dipeptide transport system ATP-binding protein
MALLQIENLSIEFPTANGMVRAVDRVSFTLRERELIGVVGESGSGKSLSMLAVMGLVPFPGRVTADRLTFKNRDLLTLSNRERRQLSGRSIAMIFQDPTTSLNPCFSVGFQLVEGLRVHEKMGRKAARNRAIALLEQVGIPAPESRMRAYPHQLSGGMNQRVMIAMAIACNPEILIADEPTTALDVTIQAQILQLLLSLQRDRGMGLILVTHNMGVVADTVERVLVMYGGQIVEDRATVALFQAPQHPYTAALLAARPEHAEAGRLAAPPAALPEHVETGRLAAPPAALPEQMKAGRLAASPAALPEQVKAGRLAAIPGTPPGLHDRPAGCLFGPRCPYATRHARTIRPDLRDWMGGRVRCHYPLGDPGRDARIAADGLVGAQATP